MNTENSFRVGLTIGTVLMLVVAAVEKVTTREASITHNPTNNLFLPDQYERDINENRLCGEKKWVVQTNWALPIPVTTPPQVAPLAPILVRIGSVTSNLQVTFYDEDRAHVLILRMHRLPDVVKTVILKTVEQEIVP